MSSVFGLWLYVCVCLSQSVCVIATANIVWARDLKFGHITLLVTFQKNEFLFFWMFDFFPRVMPLFRVPPLPTVLISNQRHSIIYWWFSKSNSLKESGVEYGAYDKIHMWWISIVFYVFRVLSNFIKSKITNKTSGTVSFAARRCTCLLILSLILIA